MRLNSNQRTIFQPCAIHLQGATSAQQLKKETGAGNRGSPLPSYSSFPCHYETTLHNITRFFSFSFKVIKLTRIVEYRGTYELFLSKGGVYFGHYLFFVMRH